MTAICAWVRLADRPRPRRATATGRGAGRPRQLLAASVRGADDARGRRRSRRSRSPTDALADALAPGRRSRTRPPDARPRRRRDERRRGQRRRAARASATRATSRSASRCGSGPTRPGPDGERVCCSPAAVVAARETCHGLGVPHVTLDLREEFRRAVVAPFVAGYARGRDAEPVHPLQRELPLRRAARVRPARRRAHGVATGHYARLVERDGRLLLARGRDAEKDQSYMLARLDPRPPRAALVPARRADEDRGARRGARRRARRGRPSREPGGVLPRGRRLPRLPRAPRPRRGRGRRSSTRRAASSAATTATGASRPASGAGSASPTGAARVRAAHRPRERTPSSSARASRSRRRTIDVRNGRLFVPVERADVKLRYRSPAAPRAASSRGRAVSGSSSTSPRTASRPARRPSSTTATSSSAPGSSPLPSRPRPTRTTLALARPKGLRHDRHDHAHHPVRPAVSGRRPPRRRRASPRGSSSRSRQLEDVELALEAAPLGRRPTRRARR